MSFEDWSVVLITAAAIPGTLALVLYGAFAKWYTTFIGCARVTAETGWVALLDVALYAYWTHKPIPEWLALTLYALIALGAWMWLGAIVRGQLRRR